MINQAQKLDLMMQKQSKKRSVRFVAITSGKGGVGKSSVSANLAYVLWKQGFRVGVLDADIGLANLDVIFGVKNEKNILHLLKGQASLKEILIPIENGLYLIPGESGEEILKYTGDFVLEKFTEETSLLDNLDFILIDTGAGIGEHIQMFLNASDEVIVVTVPDPAAITDAYATIKITAKKRRRIHVLMNMVRNQKEAQMIFEKLSKIAMQNISSSLDLRLLGKINNDSAVTKATKQRVLFTRSTPGCDASLDLENAAKMLAGLLEQGVLEKDAEGKFSRFFKKILGQF